MDRADLRGPVEGAHRLGEGDLRIGIVCRHGRDAEGLGHEGLRGGPAGLEDGVPALGLSDALQA
jgi:hypothetical protein